MRVIIAGGGETGRELAMFLSATHEVVIIEASSSRAEWLAQHIDGQVICGEASSLQTLLSTGVGSAELFIAATGIDEINLLACLTAKRAGCPSVAACLKNPSYWEDNHLLTTELKSLQILLHPILLAAQAVVKQIINPGLVADLTFASGRVALLVLELTKESGLVGQKLQHLKLPGQAVVCAVTREGVTSTRPQDFSLAAGDQIYIIGDALRRADWLRQQEQTLPPQRVLIAGGSWLGQQIACLMGKSVPYMENILLEAELSRCEELAEKLPGSRIFQGEMSEHTFLASIVNAKTDYFVAASDNDLLNIVSALLARSLNLPNIIVVARNQSSQVALKAAGISKLVSPKALIAEKVLRLLQQDNWFNYSLISCGPVQVVEVVVQEGMPLLHKRFGIDRLADDAIWGALVRQSQLISPFRAERVQVGDNLVLLLPQGLNLAITSLMSVENVSIKKKIQYRRRQS